METLFRGKNMIEIERISKKIWSKSTQKQNEYYFSSNKNVKGNKNKDIDQISLVGTVWSRAIHARILRNVLRKKWQSLSFESHLKEHKAEKTATTWYDLSVFQVHIHGHGHCACTTKCLWDWNLTSQTDLNKTTKERTRETKMKRRMSFGFWRARKKCSFVECFLDCFESGYRNRKTAKNATAL